MRKQLMKCSHGRTLINGCAHCEPPHVTTTGRAISIGRVTRASNLVRTKARGQQGGPLPFELACHPKAQSPTSRNPGCLKRQTPQYGIAATMIHTWRTKDFQKGRGLVQEGNQEHRFALVQPDPYEPETCFHVYGWTANPVYALAWAIAARQLGLICEVEDHHGAM